MSDRNFRETYARSASCAQQVIQPAIQYDSDLPISGHVDEISALIQNHQVVIVAGETGSGKTTQLPKICLQLGRRHIGHTQPRRIAARSVAERLADEIQVPLGGIVGYQVRFTRQAGRDTRVKVMTDGVLLAEIDHDHRLRRYDTIIIDEAHERSLNIDFLLGYLKQLLPSRPDLKVIITSATIDTARFAEHFCDAQGKPAPIVEVSGRSYPVEIRYRPIQAANEDDEDIDEADGIVCAVRELSSDGDVLVFLSGEREIKDAAEALEKAKLVNTEILPLFARLSGAEQHRIFQSHSTRRIILSTNIAETSLTVPGIRYVIDTGLARISRYSARTKVQRLPIEPISQASANQRAGRCGRLGPGICIRLYSSDDFMSRPEFTEPEILRTNLTSVILKMAQAELGNIDTFPFLEPPDRAQVRDGVRLLEELGALTGSNSARKHSVRNDGGTQDNEGKSAGKASRGPRLTRIGHRLAELPIDPRLGRMLVEASKRDCLREVETIVAALAIQDVRERPAEKRDVADQLHRRFFNDEILVDSSGNDVIENALQTSSEPRRYTAHTGRQGEFDKSQKIGPGGDILAMWRLWQYLALQRKKLSGNQFRRLCKREFINFMRVREWQDLRTQLRQIDKEMKLQRNTRPASTDAILTSVMSGLLSHIGLLDQRDAKQQGNKNKQKPNKRRQYHGAEYIGARGSKFAIQPGSALAKHPPELVAAVELVETSRLWARTVAEIQADWIEQVASHLLRRNYSEPHWSSSAAAVLAYERVSLYGVPIIAERLVDYARVDVDTARTLFIRAALVEEGWSPLDTHAPHDFLTHNHRLRAEVEELEERSRRRDVLVDDQTIFDFYDERIPADVCSASTFDKWWSRHNDKKLLTLAIDDLMRPEADIDADKFPDHWQIGKLQFPVSYVFDPGAGSDGVTVTIPLSQLNQVRAQQFSWQVPGLRAELATELIRSLPKSVRTSFIPAPDHAREALRWLRANNADRSKYFHEELGRALQALTGVRVEPQLWSPQDVPSHCQVNFRITEKTRNKQTKVTLSGKDLRRLQQALSARLTKTLTAAATKTTQQRGTSWIFGPLEQSTQISRHGLTVKGYPALHDDGDSVSLVIEQSQAAQKRNHAAGIRRLIALANPDPTRWVVAHLSREELLWLTHSPYASQAELLADAWLKAIDQLVQRFGGAEKIRDEESFNQIALEVRQHQADQTRQAAIVASKALSWARQVEADLDRAPESARADVRAQLDNLVFQRFISFTRDPWFGQLPRYVQAASIRLDQAIDNPGHDQLLQERLDGLLIDFDELCDTQSQGPMPDEIDDVGFMIEELRVQMFAQRLGTIQPVSEKRIRKAMERAAAQQ